MVAAEKLYTAQIRITSYYLNKLDYLNSMFNRGGENVMSSLQSFDQEWEQIRQWQGWAVKNANHDTAIARIAAAFPRRGNALLKLRLNQHEFLEWTKTGFDCSERIQDAQFRFDELLNLAFAYQRAYDYQNAGVYAQMAFDACPTENLNDQARAYNMLGTVERGIGNIAQARRYLEKGLALYQMIGDLEECAVTQYNLSSLAGMEGDIAQAREYLREALPHYRRMGDLHNVSNCLNNLVLVEYMEGNLDLAETYLRESLLISERLDYRSNMSMALTNLAAVAHAREDYDQVFIYESRSLELSRALDDHYGIAMSMDGLGKVALIRKDYDLAERNYREALAILQQMEDRYGTVECLWALGDLMVIRGDVAQAERFYQEGVENAKASSHQTGLIFNLRGLVDLYVQLRRIDEARQILRQALVIALDINAVPYQLKLLVSAAGLWHATGQSATAAHWLGVVVAHLAAEPRLRRQTDEIQTALIAALGAAETTALLAEGALLALEDVLAELIAQLGSAAA